MISRRQYEQALALMGGDGWLKFAKAILDAELHANRAVMDMTDGERQERKIFLSDDFLKGRQRGLQFLEVRVKFLMDEYVAAQQNENEESQNGEPQGVGTPYADVES